MQKLWVVFGFLLLAFAASPVIGDLSAPGTAIVNVAASDGNPAAEAGDSEPIDSPDTPSSFDALPDADDSGEVTESLPVDQGVEEESTVVEPEDGVETEEEVEIVEPQEDKPVESEEDVRTEEEAEIVEPREDKPVESEEDDEVEEEVVIVVPQEDIPVESEEDVKTEEDVGFLEPQETDEPLGTTAEVKDAEEPSQDTLDDGAGVCASTV